MSWLSLFRLQEDSLAPRGKVPLSDADFRSSLSDAETTLTNLLALHVTGETARVFADLDSAFKGFKDDAARAAGLLVSGCSFCNSAAYSGGNRRGWSPSIGRPSSAAP